jgi:uncharacterized protein
MSHFHFNEEANRFELEKNGHIAYANVRKVDGILYIDYVEAPPALRGTGAAGELMTALVKAVKQETGLKIHPICGYAASWLRKNKELSDGLMA